MSVAETSGKDAAPRASRGGFVAVPVEVACHPDLSEGAFRTYCVLRHYCFGRRSYCWPSMRTLARDRSCSEETVRRHLRELAAAGLIRVAKRGRRNVYHFAPEHLYWPTASPPVAVKNVRQRKRQEPTAVQRPFDDSSGEVSATAMPHGFVEQGFTRESIHRPPPDGAESPSEGPPSTAATTASLVAHGVSPGTAARLASSYGRSACDEAIRALTAYQSSGTAIRNPGGWLYRAITQGFLRPAVLPEQRPDAPGPPSREADEERLQRAAEAHLRGLKERRRRALAAQGIGEETDVLWLRVTERLREKGQWAPVLAAACLRRVDERTYGVQCRAPSLGGSLSRLLPAIREAVHRETAGGEAVRLLVQGDNN